MNSYFFKMTREEKQNILDAHKSVYDGFATQYGQNTNQQPLYVQDFANDKNGITVSNKGEVKTYMNMNINEGYSPSDRIGDGPHDLQNGTVDFRGIPDMSDVDKEYFHDLYPSPNEDETEYVSLGAVAPENDGCKHCDNDNLDIVIDVDNLNLGDQYSDNETEEVDGYDIFSELGDEEKPKIMEKINESLDMFKRFKKYN